MVYQIALAYISAGFSFSHHVIYIFYAVEVHAIITEGIVGFDSDISYSSTHTEGYVIDGTSISSWPILFCSPLSMAEQEYDRWLGDVEVLFANPTWLYQLWWWKKIVWYP